MLEQVLLMVELPPDPHVPRRCRNRETTLHGREVALLKQRLDRVMIAIRLPFVSLDSSTCASVGSQTRYPPQIFVPSLDSLKRRVGPLVQCRVKDRRTSPGAP